MIDCPCGFGKNIKENQKNCPICGTDLTPLHHLKSLPELYHNEGIKLIEQGQLDIAIEKLITAISLNSNSSGPYILLGNIHTQKRLYDKAISYYEKALNIDPENREIKTAKKNAEIAKAQFKKEKMREIHKRLFIKLIITSIVAFFIGLMIIPLLKNILKPPQPLEIDYFALAYEMNKEISNYPDLADLKIDVIYTDEGFNISGEVPTNLHKNLITEIVRNIVNENPVDIHNLLITTPSVSEQIKAEKDPNILTKKMKKEISNYPDLADLKIDVIYIDEGFNISGEVPTSLHKNLVTEIVKNVVGVKSVDIQNLLIIPSVPKETKFLYTVKHGDSLALLGYRFYGNKKMWKKIYETNKDKIGEPHLIFEGQVLSIQFNEY